MRQSERIRSSMLKWKTGKPTPWTGAFSLVAVAPARSSTQSTLLAFNIDETLHPQTNVRTHDAEEIARTDRLFSAWSDAGFFALMLGSPPFPNPRRLLENCQCFDKLAERVYGSGCDTALLIAATGADVRAWRLENGLMRALHLTDGLLTFSAGHCSADPLPGNGWLVEKLERLRRSTGISPADVERALRDASLGDSTVQSVIVEPAKRQLMRFDPARPTNPFELLRRSA